MGIFDGTFVFKRDYKQVTITFKTALAINVLEIVEKHATLDLNVQAVYNRSRRITLRRAIIGCVYLTACHLCC